MFPFVLYHMFVCIFSVCFLCLGLGKGWHLTRAPRLLYICNACLNAYLLRCISVAGFGLTMVFINAPNKLEVAYLTFPFILQRHELRWTGKISEEAVAEVI